MNIKKQILPTGTPKGHKQPCPAFRSFYAPIVQRARRLDRKPVIPVRFRVGDFPHLCRGNMDTGIQVTKLRSAGLLTCNRSRPTHGTEPQGMKIGFFLFFIAWNRQWYRRHKPLRN